VVLGIILAMKVGFVVSYTSDINLPERLNLWNLRIHVRSGACCLLFNALN
jgi:hypothetical protein